MTHETFQNPSKASKLTQEVPIMRRCRSLSELPGNLRVPILRRGDTERTQARLVAGAAGVEELRVLKEQRQQLFDQTIAAAHQKMKSQTNQRHIRWTADHHRLHYQQTLDPSKQQMHSSPSPLSAWHSTSSLTSISEEGNSRQTTSSNRYTTGNSINVLYCSPDQKNYPNADANQHIINTSTNASGGSHNHHQLGYHQDHCNKENKYSFQSGHSFQLHDSQEQLHCTILNHPEEKKFKSSIINTNGLASIDKKAKEQYNESAFKTSDNKCISNDDHEGCIPSTQNFQTRSRSVSEDDINYSEHRKFHNPTNVYQRHNIVCKQSDHNVFRSRSQSVHDNFYSSNAQENNCNSSLGLQNGNKHDNNYPDNNHHSSRNKHLQDLKSKASTNCVDQYTSASTNSIASEQKQLYNPMKCRTQSTPYIKTTPYMKPSLSLQARVKSKSISWDNLLVVIGLQTESSALANETVENDEENDEVFVNIEYPSGSEEETGQSALKKMRSQSFTAGCLLNPGFKYGILKNNDSNQYSHKNQDAFNLKKNKTEEHGQSEMLKRQHEKNTRKEVPSASILRRASIQCEAVLTQTNTPRKIINPLQDVDISSLQSPGPLHAVTLQYNNIPLKKTDKLASNANSSTVTSNAEHFIPEISKTNTTENCHLKIMLKNSQIERPIPRPRISILKVSQEVIPQTNYITGSHTSRDYKLLNESANEEENGMKSNENILQNTDALNLPVSNSNCSNLVAQKETQFLVNTQNVFCSNSVLEDGKLLSTDQNMSITSKITGPKMPQNSELNCSETKSDKFELNIANEQNRQSNIVHNDLSVKIQGSSNDKAVSCINDSVAIMSGLCENVNKTVILQTSSVSEKIHFTEDSSQVAQTGNTAKNLTTIFLPQNHLSHTSDTSILSDEGYSTCDSINQQSQLASLRYSQSCETNSVSSDSVASMSFIRDISCSSVKCDLGSQKNCRELNMESLGSAKSKENDEHSLTQQPKVRPSTAVNIVTGNKSQLNDKQNSTISECAAYKVPRNRTTSLNYNCLLKDKQTSVGSSELSNQNTFIKENDFASNYGDTKINKTDHYKSNVAKLEGTKIFEDTTPTAKQLNDSAKNSVSAAIQSFKQTAV